MKTLNVFKFTFLIVNLKRCGDEVIDYGYVDLHSL